MKTVIEIWYTDKDGWKSNYVATKSLSFDKEGANAMSGLTSWVITPDLHSIYDRDGINALRLLLNEIEKDLNEENNR